MCTPWLNNQSFYLFIFKKILIILLTDWFLPGCLSSTVKRFVFSEVFSHSSLFKWLILMKTSVAKLKSVAQISWLQGQLFKHCLFSLNTMLYVTIHSTPKLHSKKTETKRNKTNQTNYGIYKQKSLSTDKLLEMFLQFSQMLQFGLGTRKRTKEKRKQTDQRKKKKSQS